MPADMGVMAPTMPAATAVRASAIKDSNSPIETLRKGRGRPRKGGNGFASGTHMDTGEGPATLGVKSRKSKKGGSTFNAEDPVVKAKRAANGAKYAAAKKEGSGVVSDVIEFVKNLARGNEKYYKPRVSSYKESPGEEQKRERERKEQNRQLTLAAQKHRANMPDQPEKKRTPIGDAARLLGFGTTDDSGNPLLPTTTKRAVRATAKREVKPMTEKSQLPSSTLSGLGKMKKHNPRAEIVRATMAEHNMGMIEASKYVKANNLY